MMLLGIWLHTVVGYSNDGGRPYKDPHPTAIYNWTLGVIHCFRMPVFFLLAGFFGALLWERGWQQFVRNRLSRILVPFVVFWIATAPIVLNLAMYAATLRPAVASPVRRGGLLANLHPMHLWFLEYLLVLYAIAFVVVKSLEATATVRPQVLSSLNGWFRALLRSSIRPVIFAIPSAFILMLMRNAVLEDPPGFVPVPRIVAAYAVPFFFGWILYLNRDMLDTLRVHAWRDLLMAALLVAGWMIFIQPVQDLPGNRTWVIPARAVAISLLMWLLAFGLRGVFLRYFNTGNPAMRYLADGSYWIYLMHMVVVMGLQIALARVAVDAAFKVPVVVVAASVLLVLSYDVMVRSTWIGALLNGRRYPRWFATEAPVNVSSTARTSLDSAS